MKKKKKNMQAIFYTLYCTLVQNYEIFVNFSFNLVDRLLILNLRNFNDYFRIYITLKNFENMVYWLAYYDVAWLMQNIKIGKILKEKYINCVTLNGFFKSFFSWQFTFKKLRKSFVYFEFFFRMVKLRKLYIY